MSINSCTINRSSINAFCAGRRQVVLDGLLNQKYPITPPVAAVSSGSGRVLRDNFHQVPRPFEFEDVKTLNFEQPFITVTATLYGSDGAQTLENTPQTDFVTVTGLTIEASIMVAVADLEIEAAPVIQISDLQIGVEETPVAVNITDFNI